MPESTASSLIYPFSAIVGQDSMKLALALAAINSAVGGVLIRGEKGTAKSTAVRALAKLLPKIEVAADCPYSCDPHDTRNLCDTCRDTSPAITSRRVRVVELPLNATEDMVVGGLDFSASLRQGERVFQPGLLARVNRGILYVDEVNLLADHLVEAILDVAASGHNLVQREGISHSHPARFILVGTMNPEEGELRPQLLDRFGLCVEVRGELDIPSRVEVQVRRDEFDRSPLAFFKGFEDQEQLLAARISRAASILPTVRFPKALSRPVSEICIHHHVAGHRADIVIAQAARALAAYEGRNELVVDDLRQAAILAIPHRARDRTPSDPLSSDSRAHDKPRKRAMQRPYPEEYPKQEPSRASKPDSARDEMVSRPPQRPIERPEYPETIFDVGPTYTVTEIARRRDRLFRHNTGKRSRTHTRRKKGRYVRSTLQRLFNDIAFDATLRASAPHQLERRSGSDLLVTIRDEDIREKVRESRTANFLLFIVDASGSMGAKGRMTASKGAIMSLLKEAYQKRDRVAMVTFRKQEAVVNLPPTSSISRAGELLRELPVGGKTPLAAGLRKGLQLVSNSLVKDPACRPIVIVITDGKANESLGKGDPFWEALDLARSIAADKRVKSIVVDAEETDGFRFGLSERLADVLNAEYFRIKDLKADVLLRIARSGM